MKVFHFIPLAERELHQADTDCDCEPELIEQYLLSTCDDYDGEVCYRHKQYGPDEAQDFDEDGAMLHEVFNDGETLETLETQTA